MSGSSTSLLRLSMLVLLLSICLTTLSTSGMSLFRQEAGSFVAAPDVTTVRPSRLVCAISCVGMANGFCGGFSYHTSSGDGSVCHLFRGVEEKRCVNPMESPPPLQAESGLAETVSYRRLQASCPGSIADPCSCPAGFQRCAGRCLATVSTSESGLSFSAASALCAQLDAHLAVPRSEQENHCLSVRVPPSMSAWLGVSNVANQELVTTDGSCGPVPGNDSWWQPAPPAPRAGEDRCVFIVAWAAWVADQSVSCDSPMMTVCQLANCYQPHCQ